MEKIVVKALEKLFGKSYSEIVDKEHFFIEGAVDAMPVPPETERRINKLVVHCDRGEIEIDPKTGEYRYIRETEVPHEN